MADTNLELLVEPFREGRPGPHVQAALAALTDAGLEVDVGPFATSASGSAEDIAAAVQRVIVAALGEGASRVSLTISRADEAPASAGLHGALDRLVASVEHELGDRLPDLSRDKKQAAVRLLDERGAFLLRRSVEDVAELMGVSRITIYNYLNAIATDPAEP